MDLCASLETANGQAYGTPGLSYVNVLYYMQSSSHYMQCFFIRCGIPLIICAIYDVIGCAFVVICCGFATICGAYVIIFSDFSIISTFCHSISTALSFYRVVYALYCVQTISPRVHFALFAVLSSLYRTVFMIYPQCKVRVSDPSSPQPDAAILVCFRGKVEERAEGILLRMRQGSFFGAFGAILIFSARFCGFSTERSTPLCDTFWKGMKDYDKFTTISNSVDTRGVCWLFG